MAMAMMKMIIIIVKIMTLMMAQNADCNDNSLNNSNDIKQ